MKRRICIFLLTFVSSLYVCGKKYEARTPWFSNSEERGAVITKVTIKDCEEEKIVFSLQKEMTHFHRFSFSKRRQFWKTANIIIQRLTILETIHLDISKKRRGK